MSKLLKIILILVLAIVVGVAAMLIWGHGKGAKIQETFYQAVLSGDPQQVRDLFHADFKDPPDPEVLAAWMAAVKEHLGAFKGLAKTKFSTKTGTSNGRTVTTSKGTVLFEKGEGDSEIQHTDDKLNFFKLTSDKLPENWFQALPDTASYEANGKTLLEELVTGKIEAARARMHENLRAKVPVEQLTKSSAHIAQGLGTLQSLTVTSRTFTPGTPAELAIEYDIAGSSGNADGYIRYQFVGWRGHVLGFNLKAR